MTAVTNILLLALVMTNHVRRTTVNIPLAWSSPTGGCFVQVAWSTNGSAATNAMGFTNFQAASLGGVLTNLPVAPRYWLAARSVATGAVDSAWCGDVTFSGWASSYVPMTLVCGTNAYTGFPEPTNQAAFFRARSQTNLLELLLSLTPQNPNSFDLWWMTVPPSGCQFPTTPPILFAAHNLTTPIP